MPVRRKLQIAFGIVLRRYRTENGWSQEQLAERADLARNFIGMLERGERQPSLGAIQAIADALGKRPHELIRAAEELEYRKR